jgi:hypothetical protein
MIFTVPKIIKLKMCCCLLCLLTCRNRACFFFASNSSGSRADTPSTMDKFRIHHCTLLSIYASQKTCSCDGFLDKAMCKHLVAESQSASNRSDFQNLFRTVRRRIIFLCGSSKERSPSGGPKGVGTRRCSN